MYLVDSCFSSYSGGALPVLHVFILSLENLLWVFGFCSSNNWPLETKRNCVKLKGNLLRKVMCLYAHQKGGKNEWVWQHLSAARVARAVPALLVKQSLNKGIFFWFGVYLRVCVCVCVCVCVSSPPLKVPANWMTLLRGINSDSNLSLGEM